MNTRRSCVAAVAIGLLGGGSAFAGGEYLVTDWLDVGSGELGGGESLDADLDLTGINGIVGFEVAFSFVQGETDGSWASDARVIVDPGGDDPFSVGGFTNLPSSDEEWSFQGPGSEPDGRYGDSGDDLFLVWEEAPIDGPIINVSLANDRVNDPNPNGYDTVQARFYYAIPAPGALTLLGLAGLTGHRRRRV